MSTLHTKERILDAAEEIMWKRSFHAVGLNEILKAVGVPKGSFYHYFESKEHFGVELLKHYIAEATEEKTRVLLSNEPEQDPIQRIYDMLGTSIEKFEESGRKCPCLVLKLASEVTDLSEPMREVLAEGMVAWLDILCAVFEEAKIKGMLSSGVNPLHEAKCLRDLWAGAIQRSTIMKSTEPMQTALTFIRDHLSSLATQAEMRQPA